MSSGLIERTIPGTDERLPIVGLGTFRAFDVSPRSDDADRLSGVLDLFGAQGGRVIDTSPMYGQAEAVIGELRARAQTPVGGSEPAAADRRVAPFLASKVWTQGRREGIAQMERTMQRLRTTRMDLMQVHNLVDVETHLDTLQGWKQDGRVRYIGITHYHGAAFDALETLLRSRAIDFVQFNYNVGDREAELRLLPAAADTGTAVLVNRPLGQGALLARTRGRPVPAWAASDGYRSWAQLALAFLFAHPAVSCVIPATGDPEHLAENLDAARVTPERPAPDAAFARRVVKALGAP